MEQGAQIIAKVLKKDNTFVCFTENQVFQLSNPNKQVGIPKKQQFTKQKSIFNQLDPTKKLHLKIINTKIIKNNISKFIIKVWDYTKCIKVEIQGKEELERLYKLIGYYSFIIGLQEVTISLKNIGEGAFAQVYEVITNYQMRFAIKCFAKKTLENNQKLKKSFQNQILIMKTLKSKYIVSFDYVFETTQKLSLKLQYFEKTLSTIISQKSIVKKQKNIMKQLLLALLELKNKCIIHRDLKPDNIMIRKTQKGEEQCVLIDFGLATFVDNIPYLYHRCGTPGFIAPQIANLSSKKTKQTCSVDMFSLGCIFYQLLSGHHLFSAKKVSQLLEKNRKCEFALSALDKLSDQQKHLLLKMIDRSPNSRITPQDALIHPYFKEDIDDDDEIPEQQCQISKNLQTMARHIQIKNMEDVYSSAGSIYQQSIISQAYRRSDNRKFTVKDSCLTFEFGPKQKGQMQEKRQKRKRNPTVTANSGRQSRFSTINKLDISIL